jgi:FkbM family methyltransferase
MLKIRNYNLGNYIVPVDTINGVCLEIGGNVGSFTQKYQNHFKTIHVYEPLAKCVDIIKSKTISQKHINIFHLAGYHTTNETVEMLIHNNKDSGSTGLKGDTLNSDWTDVIETVKTISLPDMIKNLHVDEIDYCKSDCETSEYHIFLNQDLTKIKYLAMELHNQMGIDKWNELLTYIQRTHTLITGNTNWTPNQNSDLFFKRKS